MRAPIMLALLTLAAAGQARAQSVEDKLRDALRHATVDLRALQDSQAQLQADRDTAARQRDALQQQLTEALGKLAQQAPQAPAVPAIDPEELTRLQGLLQDARRQIASLTASNVRWQAAYQQAAALVQAKEAEAKRLAQGLLAAQKEDQLSRETNQKLAGLADDILHLYRSQDFRGILLRSYEPLLGFGKVKLDNTVQDYDDRIAALRLYQAASQRP